ncbi:hypothetical protein N7462_009540 [Penicillium macrosclerotiorum]|uniref:uncharacterized protein n=1 Tax=Penicillium macrosclerotiorum TaxID=303699 RepID=UPI002548A96F|nr:uncharacterized protein N7462_009540 [Penicillium macrosclerotiorum]KAJ5674101.1 hypothetical protein N7462_009540 [Penicillium macrosclerotiorum]
MDVDHLAPAAALALLSNVISDIVASDQSTARSSSSPALLTLRSAASLRLRALAYFIPVQRNFPTKALIFFIKPRRCAIAVGPSDIACRFGQLRG